METWYRKNSWSNDLEELCVVSVSPKSIIVSVEAGGILGKGRFIERRMMLNEREIFRTKLDALQFIADDAVAMYEIARARLTAASKEKERAEIALSNFKLGLR